MPLVKSNHNKTMELPGLGRVLFACNRRAKRISIALKPFQAIRVTLPTGVSLAGGLKFVQAHLSWVREKQQELKNLEQKLRERAPCPANLDPEAATVKICQRLAELAGRHGFSYGRVTIRRQRTRWGSCSARNNLSLNLKLAALPGELMDLVLLHELVHTRIKHHGPEFWAELERLAGDARQKSLQLRQYHLALL